MASSGKYPRKVTVRFKKLEEKSLWNYVSLHSIDLEGQIRPSKEELEIICAEHFAQWEVDEEKVVESWIAHMDTDRDVRELGAVKKRNNSEFSPYGPYGHGEAPAFGGGRGGGFGGSGCPLDMQGGVRGVVPSGEQVAAKVTNTNENGSWILAEIIRYLAGRACYEVKDADDPLKQIEVPDHNVIRLREGGQGFAKGDDVLAVFPDTTSFYRGTISKQPVRKAGLVAELVVQFEDDADQDTGKTPHRRINSKLVLAQPGGHYNEDDYHHHHQRNSSHNQHHSGSGNSNNNVPVYGDDHSHHMPASRGGGGGGGGWGDDRNQR
ncbi:unnamed protein product, partial [Ectocarpus sp. 12 AP-2014]